MLLVCVFSCFSHTRLVYTVHEFYENILTNVARFVDVHAGVVWLRFITKIRPNRIIKNNRTDVVACNLPDCANVDYLPFLFAVAPRLSRSLSRQRYAT